MPDVLATGLLAGLHPMAGLYGYMVGTATGALLTSSAPCRAGRAAMVTVIADVTSNRVRRVPTCVWESFDVSLLLRVQGSALHP